MEFPEKYLLHRVRSTFASVCSDFFNQSRSSCNSGHSGVLRIVLRKWVYSAVYIIGVQYGEFNHFMPGEQVEGEAAMLRKCGTADQCTNKISSVIHY